MSRSSAWRKPNSPGPAESSITILATISRRSAAANSPASRLAAAVNSGNEKSWPSTAACFRLAQLIELRHQRVVQRVRHAAIVGAVRWRQIGAGDHRFDELLDIEWD